MPKRNHSSARTSRRDFAKSLALLAAAPLAPTAAQQPAADLPVTVAETLTEVVRLRHGKDLSAEQLQAVRGSIARSQRSAELMKKVKLANGDEPAFVFSAEVE